VTQLWEDLESIGPENLYPYEIPTDLLGWAAMAYHNLPDKARQSFILKKERSPTILISQSSSSPIPLTRDKKDNDEGFIEEREEDEECNNGNNNNKKKMIKQNNSEKAIGLMRRLGQLNMSSGISWSWKIYGE